ncbi:flagellar assembly peptidoglycan hydrolase FlgJ [Nitrincola iocasae]|jgi:flagellar protein FlgJ|uniref:Peptidoglycan hydrolase FlgJ n=1 Tax=Nitrincola iocasae TaxID=2614693 RepID=A0A5J6LGN1_9GAMM|nr:flagellar assembly peptidoglycan hydrolase FlgJ [Nitrincola iocasae]QEW07745.1 flagellar assembly peptidoglycan hydrolase FlgJ [Nitrincola iocasae]
MVNNKPAVATQNPQFYTELNQLSELRRRAGDDEQGALREVAQQFEQIFMNMMLKSMRDANAAFGEDNPFNSNSTRFFQDMYDQQMTLDLAQSSTLGLADVMVRQLSQHSGIPANQDRDDLNQSLSEAEMLLNRAMNTTAGMAASAVLGQAQTPSSRSGSEQDDATPSDQSHAQGVDAAENLPARFDSPREFVDALLPMAEEMAAELGVDPKVLLAQAALETGWGRFVIDGSNNLFNIKADSGWGGERVNVSTLEYRDGVAAKEMAAFRSYDSYADSFRDYVSFLRTNPRYQQALENTANPADYLRELQAAGYATDPAYAQKIEQIFSGNILAQAGRNTQEG